MRSSTETIIGALHVLARDIQTDDGVINACLSEAAERLQELSMLVDLYKVMASSQWTRIDYANLETYPETGKHCLVAWDGIEHDTGNALHMIIAEFDTDALVWADCSTGESNGWWRDADRPTHWMYAPEYQP